jgi:putative AdoMet-dependent methyltransferase
MDRDNRASLFDAWADVEDQTVEHATGFPFENYRHVLATTGEAARPRPGLSVLDVGTGTGNCAALSVARHSVVTGIDFSRRMINIARVATAKATFLHRQ